MIFMGRSEQLGLYSLVGEELSLGERGDDQFDLYGKE